MDVDLLIFSLRDWLISIHKSLNGILVPDRAVDWICDYISVGVRLLHSSDSVALILECDRR